MSRELRADSIFNLLHEHDVAFVLIGGLALGAHGVVRGTKDVDIVPDPEPANLARLAAALGAIGVQVDIGDIDARELGIEPDLAGLSQGGNWVLSTDLGRLDVLQDVAGSRGYEHLRAGALAVDAPGVTQAILCAGFDDLIAMKAAAGRDQDLIDIDALRRARGELG